MRKTGSEKLMDKVGRDYEEIAAEFSSTRQYLWPGLKKLAEYAKDNDRVLDLGCGNGRLFELFEGRDVEYAGLDSSRALISLAEEKYGERGARFQVGDMADLPFADGSFDAVFCVAAFHHLASMALRKKSLREMKRVLKPGGLLIMTNWNLFQKKYLPRLFDFRIKARFGAWSLKDAFIPWKLASGKTVWRYYHAFTLGELESLLRGAGFCIEAAHYESGGGKTTWKNGSNLMTVARNNNG